jgi:predicted glycogen debranching enzyme
VNGIGVTARIGKVVEVNALWLQTLRTARLARAARGADGDDLSRLEQRALSSFACRFPASGGGLLDVLDGPDGAETVVRPNQLIAVGLAPALRDAEMALGVVQQANEQLLTPLGLRSQAPGSPGYHGLHRGGPSERDSAYHTGTVWPWLIGPYVDAALKVGQPVDGVLDGLVGHLAEFGIGSVSETADGDAPHGATGCPFQAWSVAELLRAYRRVAGSS